MLYTAAWKWKVAPSNGFLQCTITVLITRVSNSLYHSSSHLCTVGRRAFSAEHPLLQPRDNWHPLCLQAERETKVGEREQRKEWEKLESRRERVSCGPIVRSREQSRFLSYLHKQTLSWLKTQRRLKMWFLWPNSRRGPWHVLSALSRGPQRPRQFEPCDKLRNSTQRPWIGPRRRGGRECREKTREKERNEEGLRVGVCLWTCFEHRNEDEAWCCLMGCLVQEPKFCCSALKVFKGRAK